MLPCPAFYVGAGDLNGGLHACMASALQMEPLPQPINPSFLYLDLNSNVDLQSEYSSIHAACSPFSASFSFIALLPPEILGCSLLVRGFWFFKTGRGLCLVPLTDPHPPVTHNFSR